MRKVDQGTAGGVAFVIGAVLGAFSGGVVRAIVGAAACSVIGYFPIGFYNSMAK